MKRSYALYCASVAGVLFAALASWWLLGHVSRPVSVATASAEHAPSSKSRARARASQVDAVTDHQSTLDARLHEVVDSGGKAADRSFNTDEERLIPMDRMRSKILEARPDLAEFDRLHRKVLRTTEELEAFRRTLKDPELIASARRELLADDGATLDEAQMGRMCRVEFLDAALEWKDNPARGEIIKTFDDIILAGNIKKEYSDQLKHSLAGDKAELYISMLGSAPEEAEQLATKAKGSSSERLIAYATLRYKAAKRNENITD